MATKRYIKAEKVSIRMPDEVDVSLLKWHHFDDVRMFFSQSVGQVAHVSFEYREPDTGKWNYFEDFVAGIRVIPTTE